MESKNRNVRTVEVVRYVLMRDSSLCVRNVEEVVRYAFTGGKSVSVENVEVVRYALMGDKSVLCKDCGGGQICPMKNLNLPIVFVTLEDI